MRFTCAILCLAAAYSTACAEPFQYSFEDPLEVTAWKADGGITLEQTSEFATEGSHSLKMTMAAGTRWFGMRRDVQLADFRNFEFLECDIKAVTEIQELVCDLRAEKFQNLMVSWDHLRPGETLKVRIRLGECDIVRFGEKANLSFWCANRTAEPQSLCIDNIRLTGRGVQGRALERLRGKVERQALPQSAGFLVKVDAALNSAETISEQTVRTLEEEWSAVLSSAWRKGAKEPYLLASESSMAKVPRRSTLASIGADRPVEAISVDLARNEYESRQLLVIPFDNAEVKEINVSASPLKNAAGESIPVDQIAIRLVDEVDISGAAMYPGELIKGLVPDPLLPNAPFALKDGMLQSVWITIHAPAGIAPGLYEGTLTISVAGREVRLLSLQARVRAFVLPEKSSLKTIFNLWSHNWVNFYHYAKYPKHAWFYHPAFDEIPMEKKMDFIDFCNRYRLGVSGMMTMSIFQKDELAAPGMKEMLERLQKTNSAFILSMLDGGTIRKDGTLDEAAAAVISEKVKESAAMVPPGTAYAYMLDEPHRQAEKGGWATVQKEAAMIHSSDPKVKNFVSSGVFLPPLDDPFVKDIDAICLLWDRTPRRAAEDYRAAGKEVWWYGANVVSKPYPDWGLDYEGIDPRIIPLMTFKFHQDGVLMWACNLWCEENCDPAVQERWPDVPWKTTGWAYQPGEGYLFYPGKGGEMWSSIRLENWRDGMEDYEYLVLLRARLPTLTPTDQARAKELLGLSGIVTEPWEFTRQPETLTAWRRAIADLLEK